MLEAELITISETPNSSFNYMSKLYKIIQSRLNWKLKAINYSKSNRYFRKENRRLRKDRDRHKHELRKSNAEIQRLNKQIQKMTLPANQSVHLEKEGVVFLTLQLFLEANISFRAVNRVLTIFSMYLIIRVLKNDFIFLLGIKNRFIAYNIQNANNQTIDFIHPVC